MKKKLAVGSTANIDAAFDGGAADSSVSYSVPAEQQAVITVDASGVVTAVAEGTGVVEIKDPVSGDVIRAVVFEVLSQADYDLQAAVDAGTTAFTVSVAEVAQGGGGGQPATDPYFANVLFLGHFDGANGSAAFVDSSSKAVSIVAQGGASLSHAQSKFGTTSLDLTDGSGKFVVAPYDNSNYPISPDTDFTIEGWIYPTEYRQYSLIFSANDSNNTFWALILDPSGLLNIWKNRNSGYILTGNLNVSLNAWTHVALARVGQTVTVYANGVACGSVNDNDYYWINNGMTIGSVSFANDANHRFVGYVDEVRITYNVARYTGNFTPPTEAFPNQ